MKPRAQLFQEGRPLIERAVRRCHLHTESNDWDDALQVAGIALWEATERFEESRCIPFRGFAWQRVLGSVQNWLGSERRRSPPREQMGVTARPNERTQCPTDPEQLPSDSDVENNLVSAVDARRARDALWRLPVQQRRIAEAVLLRGSSIAGFARRARMARTTCQDRLAVALSALHDACAL